MRNKQCVIGPWHSIDNTFYNLPSVKVLMMAHLQLKEGEYTSTIYGHVSW